MSVDPIGSYIADFYRHNIFCEVSVRGVFRCHMVRENTCCSFIHILRNFWIARLVTIFQSEWVDLKIFQSCLNFRCNWFVKAPNYEIIIIHFTRSWLYGEVNEIKQNECIPSIRALSQRSWQTNHSKCWTLITWIGFNLSNRNVAIRACFTYRNPYLPISCDDLKKHVVVNELNTDTHQLYYEFWR